VEEGRKESSRIIWIQSKRVVPTTVARIGIAKRFSGGAWEIVSLSWRSVGIRHVHDVLVGVGCRMSDGIRTTFT